MACFVAFAAFVVGGNLLAYWRAYGCLPTFEQYRDRHPGLFRHGRCHCWLCDGGRVYVHSLDATRRRHICTTCGTVLYRS